MRIKLSYIKQQLISAGLLTALVSTARGQQACLYASEHAYQFFPCVSARAIAVMNF